MAYLIKKEDPWDLWMSAKDNWDYTGADAFEDALEKAVRDGKCPIDSLLSFALVEH